MVVSYSSNVASTKFLAFTKILFRWKGSLWKVVWMEISCWLVVYAVLSAIYRFVLSQSQRVIFEDLVSFCFKHAEEISLTFILGFYVSLAVKRWWDMFMNIGWIDNCAFLLAAYIPGTDDKLRLLRRTCLRYIVLYQAMIFSNISTPVRKRFPDDQALVREGLLTDEEKLVLDSLYSNNEKYNVPIQWAMELLRQARLDGLIARDHFMVDLYEVFTLTDFNSTPIPLVYTQVVFCAVRCYSIIAVLGRQYITPSSERMAELNTITSIDLYFPMLTVIQIIFYVGWSKVAEGLLNPFGDDDDDFEANSLIDRNLKVGLAIVDDSTEKVPVLLKDIFWNEKSPDSVPQSVRPPVTDIWVTCGHAAHDISGSHRNQLVGSVDTLSNGGKTK